MARRELEDYEHVVRRVGRQQIAIDERGEARVTWLAFELRAAKMGRQAERYLSLSHFEHVDGSTEIRIRAVRNLMRKNRLPCTDKHAFAVCVCGRIRESGKSRGRRLSVAHTPRPLNPAYCGLYGLPPDNSDLVLLETLAANSVVEVVMSGSVSE